MKISINCYLFAIILSVAILSLERGAASRDLSSCVTLQLMPIPQSSVDFRARYTNNCDECVKFIPIMSIISGNSRDLIGSSTRQFPLLLQRGYMLLGAGQSEVVYFENPGIVAASWRTEALNVDECPKK